MAKCRLSFDSFNSFLAEGFQKLQHNGDLVDMTLGAEDHFVKVHRNVLALASPYIKQIIQTVPCNHPVVFLTIKKDILSYILEYVYTGEVNVPIEKMSSLIEAAQTLHIVGIKDLIPSQTPGNNCESCNKQKVDCNVMESCQTNKGQNKQSSYIVESENRNSNNENTTQMLADLSAAENSRVINPSDPINEFLKIKDRGIFKESEIKPSYIDQNSTEVIDNSRSGFVNKSHIKNMDEQSSNANVFKSNDIVSNNTEDSSRKVIDNRRIGFNHQRLNKITDQQSFNTNVHKNNDIVAKDTENSSRKLINYRHIGFVNQSHTKSIDQQSLNTNIYKNNDIVAKETENSSKKVIDPSRIGVVDQSHINYIHQISNANIFNNNDSAVKDIDKNSTEFNDHSTTGVIDQSHFEYIDQIQTEYFDQHRNNEEINNCGINERKEFIVNYDLDMTDIYKNTASEVNVNGNISLGNDCYNPALFGSQPNKLDHIGRIPNTVAPLDILPQSIDYCVENVACNTTNQEGENYTFKITAPSCSGPNIEKPLTITINTGVLEQTEDNGIPGEHETQMKKILLESAKMRPMYTFSIRGSLMMILNRYLYNLHNAASKRSLKRRWRCIEYRANHCKALVDTDGEEIVYRKRFHKHPFHDDKILKKIEKGNIVSSIQDAYKPKPCDQFSPNECSE